MYAKSIALFLMSLSLVVLGGIVFVNSFSFDCLTIQATLIRVVPWSFVFGLLGFLIGGILDNAKVRK